jgi:hypothetical protein
VLQSRPAVWRKLARQPFGADHLTVQSNPPTASQQLDFLKKIERLLSHGSFTATYKYALLIALANLAVEKGDDSDGELPIDLDDLAQEFARLYWTAPRPFGNLGEPLRQSRAGDQDAIIEIVLPVAEKTGWAYSRVREYAGEVGDMTRSARRLVCRYPLFHLQEVREVHGGSSEPDNFLYERPPASEAERMRMQLISLKPGVGACLRKLHGVVVRLCESEWARWLRKANAKLGADSKLEDELFGDERADLSHVVEPLMGLQEGRCFYSGRRLDGGDGIQVDHFIPWSMFAFDSAFNLVLVRKEINASKSASLASPRHLEKVLARNRESAGALEQMGGAAIDSKKFRSVARWAYDAAESNQWLTWDWSDRAERRQLDDSWRRLLVD